MCVCSAYMNPADLWDVSADVICGKSAHFRMFTDVGSTPHRDIKSSFMSRNIKHGAQHHPYNDAQTYRTVFYCVYWCGSINNSSAGGCSEALKLF